MSSLLQNDPTFEHGTSIKDSIDLPSGFGVGKRARKVDGLDKATGRTKYADDISFVGMLHAKIKRSTKAHAKIKSIDTSKAAALPGVMGILTGADFNMAYGVIPWTKDEYPLCVDKVRYVGDAVAAVAAVDEETANAALKLIKITYEDLPLILDCETAKITGDTPETKVNAYAKKGNITKGVSLQFGNTDEAIKNSSVVLKNSFYFCGTTHAPIEPHCAIAHHDERGKLTLISATQVPHYLHRTLADVLGLDEKQIRVIQPPVGGGFGGKSECFDLEFVVAKLAKLTGRPVKCLYTREEVFYAHRGRHPMRMEMTTAADADGKITAVTNKIDIDGGAYASFGLVTAFYAGQLLTAPTTFGSYAFEATRYYTNKPACGPKRGHGSVQPRFALEVHLDMIAEKLGLDPIELRKRNFLGANTNTINGQKVGSMGLAECLDKVAAQAKWYERRGKLPFGHGLGIATSMYISGTNYPVYPNDMPQCAVQARVDRSGRVVIFCGVADIGQGCSSVLASIACEELGVEMNDVTVVTGDTDLTPVDLGAYSSRITMMMGHAAQEAMRKIRCSIQSAVAEHWQKQSLAEIKSTQIILGAKKAYYREDTDLNISLTQAFHLAEAKFGSLSSSGSYRTTERGGDYRGGTIGSSPAYSCTAHLAEVFVDPLTGKISIDKIFVAHDCGRAINPTLVEGQIEGSTYMGAAEVFMEHMLYGTDKARQGMLLGPSLLDYRIPTSLDTPDIFANIVENPDANGPYGAKEAGEGPLHSAIPAVANAIYDAVGVRLFELPFSPKKVLDAISLAPSGRGLG